MKPVVVFLVKNGIGYGHLRRARILAETLHADGAVRPYIISQASTLDLLRGTPVPVVNLPLIQHLPNDIAADWYTDVLNQLLDRLDPALIVEDTYPDPRYLSLPALHGRPRILVLRRLDGLSFDTIRETGRLAAYTRILIAQDPEAFAREGHSGATLTAVERSGRFTFTGPIHHHPDPATVAAIRAEYCDNGRKLIVVNGGAGGDQLHDGYGDRLFAACHQITGRLSADGHDIHVVMVTGPYYAGRALPEREHLTVRSFDPHLPELLAAADIAVIKPGHNALSEALSGHSQLILVPDASFLEGLDEHCARTIAQYGGAVATPDPETLEPLIRAALTRPPRTRQLATGAAGIATIAAALTAAACTPATPTIPGRALMLALRPPDTTTTDQLRSMLTGPMCDALILGTDLPRLATIEHESPAAAGEAVFVDTNPTSPDPSTLTAAGMRLAIGHRSDPAFQRWSRLPAAGPALLTIPCTTVHADPRRPDRATTLLHGAVTHAEPAIAELDLTAIGCPDELAAYLAAIGSWLARQPVALITAADTIALLARRLLERP